MVRTLPLVLMLFMALGITTQAQELPDKITYCGIELTLTKGAKDKLANYVGKIYESPPYFNAMVDMAGTYLPFVEEAFRKERVPDDLKYLIIQESSIKADAVSSSNAVGYWQFKEDAAREYGLRVNSKVDERMHIYRASRAAAMYLKNGNNDFDNWVYAVIAYYEGLTGAVIYTDPQYYGVKKMTVTENLHWYVMKAIAHKLAYEEALNLDRKPRVWLEPFSTEGKVQVSALYEAHNMGPELFFEYNKWLQDPGKLPKNEVFTYYIPRFDSESYAGHILDPIENTEAAMMAASNTPELEIELPDEEAAWSVPQEEVEVASTGPALPQQPEFVPAKASTSPSAVAVDATSRPELNFAEFTLSTDLNYGIDYVLYKQEAKLSDIAERFNIRLSEILEWNGLIPGELLPDGKVLYIQKPKKVSFHVVEPGESLETIAQMHGSSPAKIQKKNRMEKGNSLIFVGQKLYLKKKKPKEEKIIILDKPRIQPQEVEEPSSPEGPASSFAPPIEAPHAHSGGLMATPDNMPATFDLEPPKEVTEANAPAKAEVKNEDFDPQTRWVVHTVGEGETLWSISKTYGTKVEIIKLSNKLQSEHIKEGMVLRILAKEERLEALKSE